MVSGINQIITPKVGEEEERQKEPRTKVKKWLSVLGAYLIYDGGGGAAAGTGGAGLLEPGSPAPEHLAEWKFPFTM